MDFQRRTLLAIVVSVLIWVVYANFFAPPMPQPKASSAKTSTEAKADAATATEQSVATADKGIGVRLDAAMIRIGEARAAALSEIEAVAAEATEQLVSRVSGLVIDSTTVRAAVAKELVHG